MFALTVAMNCLSAAEQVYVTGAADCGTAVACEDRDPEDEGRVAQASPQ